MAPEVGFEPTTLRLTVACSTIELLRNVVENHSAVDSRLAGLFRYVFSPLPPSSEGIRSVAIQRYPYLYNVQLQIRTSISHNFLFFQGDDHCLPSEV